MCDFLIKTKNLTRIYLIFFFFLNIQIINEKWILYDKRRIKNWRSDEMNDQKDRFSSQETGIYVRTGKEFLLLNQTIGSNRFCLQLNQLKADIDDCLELRERLSCSISLMLDRMFLVLLQLWLGSFYVSVIFSRYCVIELFIPVFVEISS